MTIKELIISSFFKAVIQEKMHINSTFKHLISDANSVSASLSYPTHCFITKNLSPKITKMFDVTVVIVIFMIVCSYS
jgi:hypothetical protein